MVPAAATTQGRQRDARELGIANTNTIFITAVAARSAVASPKCLPSGIKLCTFCTPQTGVPQGTPFSLVATLPEENDARAAADDSYLIPASKISNFALATHVAAPLPR